MKKINTTLSREIKKQQKKTKNKNKQHHDTMIKSQKYIK